MTENDKPQECQIGDERPGSFIDRLYNEKELHKEQRHKHVIHKLILSSTFFGIGQFTADPFLLHLFLYIVPFIALVHDIYIFAEHYKVQRVGVFLRNLESPWICKEEKDWENLAHDFPEKRAKWASFGYTWMLILFTATVIYIKDVQPQNIPAEVFYIWLVLSGAATLGVFGFSVNLKNRIGEIEHQFKQKDAHRIELPHEIESCLREISSHLDSIEGDQLKPLAEKVDELERKMRSEWGVAKKNSRRAKRHSE